MAPRIEYQETMEIESHATLLENGLENCTIYPAKDNEDQHQNGHHKGENGDSNEIEENDEDFEQAKRDLARWVFDEGRPVTTQFLLRHTPLDVRQIQRLMKEFLDENAASEKQLSAVYRVMGTASMDVYPFDKVIRKHTVICHQDDLNKVRAGFIALHCVNVYSVQLKGETQLDMGLMLHNEDVLDLEGIRSSDADLPLFHPIDKVLVAHRKGLKAMKRANGDENGNGNGNGNQKNGKKMFGGKKVQKKAAIFVTQTLGKDDFCTGDDDEEEIKHEAKNEEGSNGKQMETDEIAVVVENGNNHKNKSQKKASEDSPLKNGGAVEDDDIIMEEEEEESSPDPKTARRVLHSRNSVTKSPLKKRSRRIIIDSEDDEGEDDAEKFGQMENDDDANPIQTIDSDDSDSEQMNGDGSGEKGHQNGTQISVRRERIKERFIDEDGMEVVRMVTRMVEEPIKEQPQQMNGKGNNSSTSGKDQGKKGAQKVQQKQKQVVGESTENEKNGKDKPNGVGNTNGNGGKKKPANGGGGKKGKAGSQEQQPKISAFFERR